MGSSGSPFFVLRQAQEPLVIPEHRFGGMVEDKKKYQI